MAASRRSSQAEAPSASTAFPSAGGDAPRRMASASSTRRLGRADGLTKLVVDPESARLLGVGIVGPGAGELIAEGALAVEAALLAEDLALTIHAHPTLSESLMEAAENLL